jgi:hypothetical protein
MVLEAGYPSTTGFRKVVKATILVRKKPGMTDEAFIEHYNHVHAQMAAPVLQKHNVITYSLVWSLPSRPSRNVALNQSVTFRWQVAQTYCLQRDRTIMADMLRGQTKMMDYDAICTFVFKDYKDFAKFMLSLDRVLVDFEESIDMLTEKCDRYDPASKALTPDHDNFMVEDDMQMMVGDELVDDHLHSF